MFVCRNRCLKAGCKFLILAQNSGLIIRKCQIVTSGIIVTGDEVLKGQVQDTNSYFLCRELHEKGIKVVAVATVADDIEIIASKVRKYSKAYDYVLTTGGIGPTHDDVTYEAVGKAFNDKLYYNPELSEMILEFYKSTDKSHPALKMGLIPTMSKLTYGFDPQTNQRALYPIISVKNVFMFPGVPNLCERLFTLTQDQLFQSSGMFYVNNLYLVENEAKIVPALNDAVKKYPKVLFGSYPKFFHSYYDVKISMESTNKDEVNEAFAYLKELIPKQLHTEYDENPLLNKVVKINKFKDPFLLDTLDLLREFIKSNTPDNIFLYFDGGKNSTVLLHILSTLYEELYPKANVEVNGIYIEKNPKINKFIASTLKNYNLNLLKLNENSFRAFAKCSPTIFVIKGTRLSDPKATDILKYFEGLSALNPLEKWMYSDVWKIIRGLSLPYCDLYDKGYTSICQTDSVPNSHLLTTGPRSDFIYYKKAFELGDPKLENAN